MFATSELNCFGVATLISNFGALFFTPLDSLALVDARPVAMHAAFWLRHYSTVPPSVRHSGSDVAYAHDCVS